MFAASIAFNGLAGNSTHATSVGFTHFVDYSAQFHNNGRMAKTRNKLDFNQIARRIVDQATSDAPTEPPAKEKDPAAVARGRKGGLKGGKTRAAKLTADQRKASAKKAIKARWDKA